jgi:hypothetical protein
MVTAEVEIGYAPMDVLVLPMLPCARFRAATVGNWFVGSHCLSPDKYRSPRCPSPRERFELFPHLPIHGKPVLSHLAVKVTVANGGPLELRSQQHDIDLLAHGSIHIIPMCNLEARISTTRYALALLLFSSGPPLFGSGTPCA